MTSLPPFRAPFPTHALEPYLGERAVELHFELTAGYVRRANALYRAKAAGYLKPVDRQRLSFEVAGANLHKIWWAGLSPLAPGHKRAIPRHVLEAFGGSAAALKHELVGAGMSIEGSGWACLAWCKRKKHANVITFPNHAFPWNHYEPLLLLDIWEHSFLFDYGGDRKGYLKDLLKLIDWDVVASRLP